MLEKCRQAVRGRLQVVFARITSVSHEPRSASIPAIRYFIVIVSTNIIVPIILVFNFL